LVTQCSLFCQLYTKVESGTHWKEQNAPYVTLNVSRIPRPSSFTIPETGEVSFQTLLEEQKRVWCSEWHFVTWGGAICCKCHNCII